MKNVHFINSSLLFLFCFAVTLIQCKEEEVNKDGESQAGVWTATLNGGASWKAKKISKETYKNADLQYNAYGDSDQSLIQLYLSSQPKAGSYQHPIGASFTFFGDVTRTKETREDATEGELVVIKNDADSLVATFTFKTATRSFLNGKIKIKVN